MSPTLVLLASLFPSADPEFLERDGSIIGIIDGIEVVEYHIEPVNRPNATNTTYERSGFIHPARTLSGTIVTDDFSPDHPHQNGLFSTWVNVTFEGRRVDFWNRRKKNGTFRHAKLVDMTNGNGTASFSVVIEHVDEKSPDGPKVALVENRTYHLSRWENAVVIDMIGEQRCATKSPVTLNQYHYGGAAMRGARHWTSDSEADFVTDAGLHREEGNHKPSKWYQLYGPKAPGSEDFASITCISHPTNFRYPEPVRLHPTMPYGVFTPVVEEGFTITPTKPHAMRYRYVIADGRPAKTEIEELATDFAKLSAE